MTHDGRQPAGLRELADVQSPDVLRAALRRFRLRLGLWVGLVVLAGAMLVVVVTAPDPAHLFDEYDRASERVELGIVEEVDGARMVLLDAARIKENRYAIRAIGLTEQREEPIWATTPSFASGEEPTSGDGQITEIASSIQAPGVTEVYFTLPLQARRAVVHLAPTQTGTDAPLAVFDLDLSDYESIDEVTENG